MTLVLGERSLSLAYALQDDDLLIYLDGQRHRVRADRQGEQVHVFAATGAAQITEIDLLAHAGETQQEGGRLTAPMPGKMVSFQVKAGDTVSRGQPLAVMEAMKMEHTIAAPTDGVVAEILYAVGDQVLEGAELLTLSVLEVSSLATAAS